MDAYPIIMNRKILIIGAVIILVGIGVVVYFLFFNSSAGITVSQTGAGFPVAGDGTSSDTSGTTSGSGKKITTSNPKGTPKIISARLVKISSGPVVPGEVVVDVPAVKMSSSSPAVADEVIVNYIERQSGNVFIYKAHAGVITRTNNQTVPGIESASWAPDSSFAFVRYLSGTDFSTINTYALPGTQSGSGFFLPQNLSGIAVSSTSLLVLASGVNGSIASTAHLDGTHSSQLFTSPLTALHISFAGKQYLAYTKPSASLSGYAFIVSSAGHFSTVAGPLNGLVALASPSGKWLMVSSVSDNNTMQTKLINTTTGENIPLPIATIADKCVWTIDESTIYCGVPVSPSSDYSYPDGWYQGVAHFSDRIWKIDVAGRYAQLVLDFPSDAKDTLDAESLSVNPLNTELVFVNKNDGSLWGYSL